LGDDVTGTGVLMAKGGTESVIESWGRRSQSDPGKPGDGGASVKKKTAWISENGGYAGVRSKKCRRRKKEESGVQGNGKR